MSPIKVKKPVKSDTSGLSDAEKFELARKKYRKGTKPDPKLVERRNQKWDERAKKR